MVGVADELCAGVGYVECVFDRFVIGFCVVYGEGESERQAAGLVAELDGEIRGVLFVFDVDWVEVVCFLGVGGLGLHRLVVDQCV